MDIRQLRMLVEVVRHDGFSAAAEAVFATQPTISKAIRQLEDELGEVLLQRSRNGVRLTPAGQIVYRRALALLGEREDMLRELEELRDLQRGELHLGLASLGSDILFAPVFARFRQLHPQIELRVLERGSEALEESLRAGEIELAASLLPVADDLDWQPVRTEPLVALLPRQHPLAGSASLQLQDLAEVPFVLFEKGFLLNRHIIQACQARGFSPREVTRSGQPDFIVALVAAGLGVALLPRMIANARPRADVVIVPLDEPELDWKMVLAWRRGGYLSAAAQAWLRLVEAQHGQAD
ncbi:LysR family transcriptional regulator [uncultured Stenotrophomonas sp.]|jgi:DNA-binding transcriptional LysR family regulator|uniref:LysR family transcriptional regulator n=1 Tax=uncultured Stenotrophomonas sp. TaxID=165438 RepID=UPI000DB78E84|nr:LysR family transcriptional regulator [uncultured Stenotrophomonas sp.]PZU22854.1 MAG: LysR family transcriptional regulator [Stenotrophomonas sp.]